jgi:hypothetical protein
VHRILLLITFCLGWTGSAAALDRAVYLEGGKKIEVDGRRLKAPESWGLVMMAPDGVLWRIPPEQQLQHTTDDAPFKPMAPAAMAKQLLATLPAGFESYQTSHYLILHDTSKAYARWCGSLFERLHAAFTNYWTRQGLALSEPEFPLVAIVFADRKTYLKYSRPDLESLGESVVAYYHLRTNRMVMFDLTGMEALKNLWGRAGPAASLNDFLARPEAAQAVATLIHEATHQIMFNSGIHERYLDCPLWFSEGMAVYFETPDLNSSKGWAGVGKVNDVRLARFQKSLKGRPAESLKTLITGDDRFRDPKQSEEAYAEAWSLTYYLIKQRPKQYLAFMKTLSQKDPLVEDTAAVRLKQFETIFGDWLKLDREFVRSMSQL